MVTTNNVLLNPNNQINAANQTTTANNAATGSNNLTSAANNLTGASNNSTGNDSFNGNTIKSYINGDGQGSLALMSQPISNLFNYVNGIDGQDINSNQSLSSFLKDVMDWVLNPAGANQYNDASNNGTLQSLINQITGQGSSNTTANNTQTGTGTDATATTDPTAQGTNTTTNGQTGTATTTANGQTAANTPAAAPAQAAAGGFGQNGTFTLDPNFLKSEALKVKEGQITSAQMQQDIANQVNACANQVAGGNASTDSGAHAFVQATCQSEGATSGIDFSDSDTNDWVQQCKNTEISNATSCAVAQVNAVVAAAPSAQAMSCESTSQVAAAAAPVVQQQAPSAVQAVQSVVTSGHNSDPLVFDLSGNGLGTSNQKVVANIDGKNQLVNNITSGEGVMTLGGQILGDKTNLSKFGITQQPTSAQNALQLIAQQAYSEGKISSPTNLTASDLQVLQNDYGLAIRSGNLNGQDESFAQAGIKGMNVSNSASTTTNNFDGNNNTLQTNGTTFTRSNGSQGGVGDIWYQV